MKIIRSIKIFKILKMTLFFCVLGTDLLERLLQMNPRDRLTAEQALSHPYFSQLHDPVDEKEASGIFDDSFEDIATTPELKQAIFNEVSHIAIHGPHWNGLPEGSRQ